jgi:hypothetical protein
MGFLLARLRIRPAVGRETARLVRLLWRATLVGAALRLDFLAVPTMQLGFDHCLHLQENTEGVGERLGRRVPPTRPSTARVRTSSALSFTSPALPSASKTRATVLMAGEARTPVSPTPSVVDRDRRRRNAAAMRNPLIDSRRPV